MQQVSSTVWWLIHVRHPAKPGRVRPLTLGLLAIAFRSSSSWRLEYLLAEQILPQILHRILCWMSEFDTLSTFACWGGLTCLAGRLAQAFRHGLVRCLRLLTDSIDMPDLLALVLIVVEGVLFEMKGVFAHDDGVSDLRSSRPGNLRTLLMSREKKEKRS
ncbi:hypothetical protein H113_05885 [Trichophyton rubrum MR1459]|uniref:Uncharacterized protein n=1 Tax=Trichophyton rubrum (strain ATCC MYA-4607 / CBS 118892) TaxID=559305 RepID=A0A080WM96_TRIRC|nr:uncharacterized protein TERG_12011 [Trichophyton rubrum CBS 118892]EZF93359.1 hypothetical protein H113_05885 [Trichophyton rubrum MR1459]EZG04814.1 hypothetical protein H106_05681 [Trichophyton rubrum CBS 735.88]KFL61235.1 hypothetical protein TERG_12011 [Trichophyton rubrum CBS 118892]